MVTWQRLSSNKALGRIQEAEIATYKIISMGVFVRPNALLVAVLIRKAFNT